MASAGLWITYTTTVDLFEAQLVERGRLLAASLNHSAMVAETSIQVQHVVDQLSLSPHIESVVVATSEPPEIMASSNRAWNGTRLHQLPDRHLGEHFLRAMARGEFGHHFDDDGEVLILTAPLEAPLVDHSDHDPSMMPSGAAPGQGTAQGHGVTHMDGPSHDNEPSTTRDPPPYRGAIMLFLDSKGASTAVSQILWLLCIALLAAVLITMSIAYVLVDRQIVARLNVIRSAMTRQKSGDGAMRAPIAANDEISDLGRAFNNMVDRIDTETRRREDLVQELKDSENRFQGFAEIGADWMWEMDADLRFSYFSDPIHKISGLPREHYLGKTRLEVGQGSIDDEKWHRHLADLEAHRPFRDLCYINMNPDGQRFYWSTSGEPVFDSSGIFVGYRGIGSDITERKRTEEALRESEVRLAKTAKIAKVGYWVWDEIEDKAVYCSDELAEINGVATGRELAAMLTSLEKDLEWVHPDDRDRIAKTARESMAEQRGYDIEFRIIRSDGEVRHLREILEPVLDDEGNLIRSNGIIQDITERKQAEDQLRQAHKMEAVGQLTGGVAHDFNNLLAVILGNAELAADRLGKDDKQVEAIVHAATRGAELTQRLLSFSRQQALRPQTVDLNACVTGMTDMLRRTLEEHIDIETVTAAGLWNCEVDPAQLENALVNLAINARDAMPDGGKLTIETANARLDDDYAAAQAEVRPGQYVMLAVTDNGSGMALEVQRHVFEPFFTTKAVGKGSGLGLAMIYGFVKQSGGHVTIYSEPGEGTTVKLYLPRSTRTEVAEKKPVTDEVPVARGETVLVVEDDPDLRTLAVTLLGNLDYQVLEAATAAAALEQLGTTTRVNLLLTDVVMPGGMNGRELAAEVERRAPGINVLYMSGYTEDAIMHHGRLDADAKLLQKPFSRADLARAVRCVLDG